MNNPKRWIDNEQQPEIGRLLRAAHGESPPRRAVERTLLLLGTATAVGALSTFGATTAKAASSTLGWAFAKWGAVAVLGLSVAVSSVIVARRDARLSQVAPALSTGPAHSPGKARARALPRANDQKDSKSESTVVTNNAPSLDRGRVPVKASAGMSGIAEVNPEPPNAATHAARFADEPPEEVNPVVDTPAVNAGSDAPSRLAADAQLVEELRWIDAARVALSHGSPSQALTMLDAYNRQCQSKRLLAEALLLRMQAFVRLHDRVSAIRIAQEIVARFPNSPHALRARELLGMPGN